MALSPPLYPPQLSPTSTNSSPSSSASTSSSSTTGSSASSPGMITSTTTGAGTGKVRRASALSEEQDGERKISRKNSPSQEASTSSLPPQPAPPPPPPHVDIVSYPSTDLLKLLAALLDQIAKANDSLISSRSSPPQSTTPDPLAETFDPAPLNSPVTPRRSYSEDRVPIPVTPGSDLARETGERGSVMGFMPSLGGNVKPIPLGRRRGSSFLKNGGTLTPSASGSGSGKNGKEASVGEEGEEMDEESGPSETEPPAAPPNTNTLLTASSVALSSPSATLCFHARNVPAISIESYLLRILKYCPTTNEVFLSLLVYFDRMARVGLEGGKVEGGKERLFAIDSFNVHRLVIAGVTVASKFFSDVFYTNSRYAKVGGLPLNELNQLELQFLLLNDFRLVIPVDELQRYADQLILFWVGRSSTHPALLHQQQSPVPLTKPVVVGMAGMERPRSIRSEPSESSGTSGTSTITPGTDEESSADEESAEGEDGEDGEDGGEGEMETD